MNYNDLQKHTFQEATKLAANGDDFSHLIQLLSPDHFVRLRCFVRDLPDNIREKTIFGRANPPAYTKKKK